MTVLVLLVLDEESQQIICLGFIVDGITVFERGSSETWSAASFVQRYLKKAGDLPIKSCEVPMLETSTETANEFFATLKQRDTLLTGFKKFHIARCLGMESALQESILEDLAQKLRHVKDFRVAYMH